VPGKHSSPGIKKIWISTQLTIFILAKTSMERFYFRIWYGIHPQDAEKFEALARKFFPEESKKCPEFLRHKTYLINPSILVENGLRIHK
jgi:hypothetical protein